jgi:hypothetical protein
MESQRKRTALIICAMSVLIAAVVVFISFELQRNQSLYIDNYLDRQQQFTDQIALHFQEYIEAQGLSEDTAVNNIISEVNTSGNSYWFVANNEELLFVKDNVTTDLYESVPLSSYLQESNSEDLFVIKQSITVGGVDYTIGNCIAKSYITEDGQLFKHYIYVIMPLILISSIILVIVIFCILMLNRQETIIIELKKEAIERNITIEQLTTRIKKSRLNDLRSSKGPETSQKDKQIYSKEVLGSLLAKINRENIVPMSIIIIELSSKNKIYSADEYQGFVKEASAYLTKEHVLAEIIPGIFTILMFHTSAENKDEIKKTLINEWALPLRKNGIKVRMGITCIENYDSNVENVFELVYREISGISAENQIRLTS